MDIAFDALANDYRRQLLLELVRDTPQRIPELSGASAELAESDAELLRRHLSSRRTVPDADEELLRIHYVHLPKLNDYGFVQWDRGAHVVTRGPRFDELRPLLEFLAGRRSEPYAVTVDDGPPSGIIERDMR